ncbi:MAG TPA: ABC transporter ATP-binding protein [Orrella sp.]
MSFGLHSIRLAFDGVPVINGVDLSAQSGATLCLLGPSGCGKTTLLRILAGLEAPDAGTVTLGGKRVFGEGVNVPPEKRQVGYLFQDYALFPHLTVSQNVAFGIQGWPNVEREVADLLASVNLSGFENAMPSTLSGGQQQRVALARALARRPQLMLLDEPFSGLDTELKLQLRESTHRLLKEHGITAIIVTHDPEEAMYMADRIVLMSQGSIVQTGSPQELYNQPINQFCARFLGDTLTVQGTNDGQTIHTSIGTFLAESGHPAGDVTVLVRPESLTVQPGEGPYQVLHRHFVGSHTLVDLVDPQEHLPDLQVLVTTERSQALSAGQSVKLVSLQPHPLLVVT